MSNRILTNNVVSPLREQPLTTKSLDFLQDNIQAVQARLALSLYPYNEAFAIKALSGCELVASGTQVESGFFFGGAFLPDIYTLNGAVITGWSNPPLCVPVTTYSPTADPLTFSDGSVFNVHAIREYNVVDQPISGAPPGSFLHSSMSFINTHAYALTSAGWSGFISVVKRQNVVYMKGTITSTTPGSSPFAFTTIPAPLRPASSKVIPTTVYDDGTEYASHVNILSNGTITNDHSWVSATAVTKWYFDGLSYYVGTGI